MTTTTDVDMLKLQYQVCWEQGYQQAIMTRHSRDYSLDSYSGPRLGFVALHLYIPDSTLSLYMLRGPGLQSGVLCGYSPSLLLDMPTFRLQLGSLY